MAEIKRETVLDAIKNVRVEGKAQNAVALGMIQGLVIRGGNIGFSIEVSPDEGPKMEPLRQACEKAVLAIPGVLSVTAVLTADRGTPAEPKMPQRPQAQKPGIPGVKSIIAVASGKGGVGKSTTAVNLALALQAIGKRTGLLDADVYGPSIPRMMGIEGRPQMKDKKLLPMRNHGLPCMSIGFLVDSGTATVWRGPMVVGALQQLMKDVAWDAWGDLDILVVDMPPGTGDTQITMAQRVPLAGAIIVSTPQDIALIDAHKGVDMFNKVNVPILGIIENMSYFVCPHCGKASDIFGHGGARETAVKMGAPFLGEVPLHISIRETSDSGQPIVVSHPDSEHAQAYVSIAGRMIDVLDERAGNARKAPNISFEQE